MSLVSNAEPTSVVDVLPLVLQHSRLSSAVRSVCSLLCTSQQATQAVQQNCIGKISIRVQQPAAMTWFAKHWRLVKLIHMVCGADNAAVLEACDKGLRAAAARCVEAEAAGVQGATGISQLQSIKAVAFPSGALSHLRNFTTLTSLSIDGLVRREPDFGSDALALAGLTSLRCLSVSTAAGSLLPGTSSLTNLTSVSVLQLTEEGVSNLRHLPAQLQELTLTFNPIDLLHVPVDLSHLTGLTRLIAAGDSTPAAGVVVGWATVFHFGSNDKLPPNCRHLSVQDVVSAQPLLELQQLERLEVTSYHAGFTQQPLQQLSSLSSLSDLQINVDVNDLMTAAWHRLPSLRGLRVHYGTRDRWEDAYCELHPVVLRRLSQLSTLQRLSLDAVRLPASIGSSFGDALKGMCRLQSLWLHDCAVGEEVDEKSSSTEFAGVVATIARLPALRDLRLAELRQWDAAASAALAAATQLTGLLLASCTSLKNEFVSVVERVQQLVGLRSLWVTFCDQAQGRDVLDVDAAASSLVHLTELCLQSCEPCQLSLKFAGAAVGCACNTSELWELEPCDKAAWIVQWWWAADNDWVVD